MPLFAIAREKFIKENQGEILAEAGFLLAPHFHLTVMEIPRPGVIPHFLKIAFQLPVENFHMAKIILVVSPFSFRRKLLPDLICKSTSIYKTISFIAKLDVFEPELLNIDMKKRCPAQTHVFKP